MVIPMGEPNLRVFFDKSPQQRETKKEVPYYNLQPTLPQTLTKTPPLEISTNCNVIRPSLLWAFYLLVGLPIFNLFSTIFWVMYNIEFLRLIEATSPTFVFKFDHTLSLSLAPVYK